MSVFRGGVLVCLALLSTSLNLVSTMHAQEKEVVDQRLQEFRLQAEKATKAARMAEERAKQADQLRAELEEALENSLGKSQEQYTKSIEGLVNQVRELQVELNQRAAKNQALRAELDALRATLATSEAKRSKALAEYTQLANIDDKKSPQFWIGIQCIPLNEDLHAFLDIDVDAGTVVNATLAESPAMKAGIEPYDVIVSANGKKIESVIELTNVIDQAQTNPVELEIIRKGKKLTLTVTPETRPDTNPAVDAWQRAQSSRWPQTYGMPSWEDWNERLEQARKNGVLTVDVVPSVVAQAFAFRIGNVPEDFTLEISKSGKEPAKIKVTRGDDSWEAQENELDKLPNDIRKLVTRALGPNRILAGQFMQPPGVEYRAVPRTEYRPVPNIEYRLTQPKKVEPTKQAPPAVEAKDDDQESVDASELEQRIDAMEKMLRTQSRGLEKQLDAIRKQIQESSKQ